jgi:hypothetical protein
MVSWWCVAFWHSFVKLCTGYEQRNFPHVKGLVGQTLCKSYHTHLILLHRLMLTVVTMVATNQFPKDCVYLRINTKLHLSKDTLQYSGPRCLDRLTEIALSRLDTQWGFTDSTPVEARCVFAYAGILIKELPLYVSKSAP